MCNVSDGALVADQIFLVTICQVGVENPIQTSRLIDVAIFRVGARLSGVASEMVCLALHRANAGIHEKEPVGDLNGFSAAGWEADFVILVISLDQVLHDAAAFENADFFAVGEGVGDGGDSAIRINL